MRCKSNLCCVLLLLVLCGWDRVLCQQRISQAKCQEYRDWAASHSIRCDHRIALIPGGFGHHPHHALLGYKSNEQSNTKNHTYHFLSVGSLISDRYVLTAAHSAQYQKPEVVRLGEADLGVEDEDHVDYEIAEVIRHPKYSARLAYHDIALIRLKEPVRFSEYIRPACLWDSMEMNFTSVEVTQFGLADYALNPRTVQTFKLDIVNVTLCEELFGRSRKFRDGMMDHQLCLAQRGDLRDTCQGESGSPAQIPPSSDDDCVAYVVGVASFGSACLGQPLDAFSRVASFIDWIESVVWA